MEVEMKIRGLMMDPATNMPIVILKEIAIAFVRQQAMRPTDR